MYTVRNFRLPPRCRWGLGFP